MQSRYPHRHNRKTLIFGVVFRKLRRLLGFFVVGGIFFMLLTGLSPLDIYLKYLSATKGDLRHINIYPSEVQDDNNEVDYMRGWWSAGNALGEEDLAPDEKTLNFNDNNSAFYSGGNYSLVFSSFDLSQAQKDAFYQEVDGEQASTTNVEYFDDILDYDSIYSQDLASGTQAGAGSEVASSTGDDLNIELGSSTDDLLASSSIGHIEASSSEAELFDPDTATSSAQMTENVEIVDLDNEKIINQATSSESTSPPSPEAANSQVPVKDENVNDTIKISDEEVEVVEVEEVEAAVEEIEEEVDVSVEEESGEEDGEDEVVDSGLTNLMVNAWRGIKNYFSHRVQVALANQIVQPVEGLEDLGEFRSAKLKYSLALHVGGGAAALNPPAPKVTNEQALNVNSTSSSSEIANDSASSTDKVDDLEVLIESDNATGTPEEEGEVEVLDMEAADDESDENLFSILFKDLFGAENALAQDFPEDAHILIWYSLDKITGSTTDDILWQRLDYIGEDNISNYINGGYFEADLPFTSWQDVRDLKIKFEATVNDQLAIAYLDSTWVEVEYERVDPLEEEKKRKRWEEALDYLGEQTVFSMGKEGEMRFRYNKNEERIWDTLSEIMGFENFWQDVEIRAQLTGPDGQSVDAELAMIFEEDGEFVIVLPATLRDLRPGKYSVRFYIEDGSGDEAEIFTLSQSFYWGVVAMNFNKSVYTSNEAGLVQMAVLNENGHTICNAGMELEIVDPDGNVQMYSTESGKIVVNPACGPKTVTDEADYTTNYLFLKPGVYTFNLTVNTDSGERFISESIQVREEVPFDVERISATRIWPQADYTMSFNITANRDWRGDLHEVVPAEFKIKNASINLINDNERDLFGSKYKYYESVSGAEKKMIWQDIEIMAGDELEISYTYDAPDRSPELFLIGPLNFGGEFFEAREWQIASDSINKRARTVMFPAGTYSGGGSSGNATNADYTFSSFNFRLAETGVDIKSAFVLYEAQIEAYSDGSGNYTGYKLAFDSCEESCTPAAFSGLTHEDTNVLAYDGTESQQVRLLMDITEESDLAAYTGGGVELDAQVGYRINKPSTISSIANAKAVLYLTYTYDEDSENITNTVVYPLDSTSGSDSGSRQSADTGDCSFGSCPAFSYTMDLPEFPGVATSTYRLADWFQFQEVNDLNGGTDIDVSIQIDSTPSSSFHHECSNGSTQANVPAMYFDSVPNYSENEAQQVEYRAYTGGTDDHLIIGGEVYETYIASSSASVKTRTVVLPVGVLSNGNDTAANDGYVDVYFPENGSATGTVEVKSAWLRILSHNHNSGGANLSVATRVGGNATTSALTYAYDPGGMVVKPAFKVIHIIPSSDYSALEEANAHTPVQVGLAATASDAEAGGVSAELVVTYAYSSEADGYLSNISLFAGQTKTAPTDNTTATTAPMVFPESGRLDLRGASLWGSFLNSDTGGAVPVGSVFTLDMDMSTSTPSCSTAYEVEPDDTNSFSEYYENMTSSLSPVDGTVYNVCLASDEPLTGTDGAKANAILSYVYQWTNEPPTGEFNSAAQKNDGSQTVDVSIEVDDINDHTARAKLEFATGTACVFTASGDPTLDETDSNITADFGDPNIENDNEYQIGTVDAYIETASGSNSVFFDWLAGDDLKNVEGDYCLRLTANDKNLDQTGPATTTVYVDTLAPTSPGALSLVSRTGTTTTLLYGATSTETSFREYIIYYKAADGTAPKETDSVWASSSDINLDDKYLNDATTTTITGLTASTTYSFAIWAYDAYGNAASSSFVNITTNDAPTGYFTNAEQRNDGTGRVDLTIEVDDANNHDTLKAKLEYSIGGCSFSPAYDPTLDENQSNILADFGTPIMDNSQEYQLGSTSGWILTSPGQNAIEFDWLAKLDQPLADDTYCLRLTVNDRFDDQLVSTTTTLTIDNKTPTSTGAMTEGRVDTDSVTLAFAVGSPGQDTNEPATNAYKIFYKAGTSGVSESDTEHDASSLDAYDFNGATSTMVTGLAQNTWYVFNIWTYDQYGNKATGTEIAVKTNATLSNDSLTLTNGQTSGTTSDIVVADDQTEYNFQVVVSETNGWYAIGTTTLRLADSSDDEAPFNDLKFYWDQTADEFYEIGSDALDVVTLADSSTSTCSGTTCTLNFNLIFNKNFASTSRYYSAQVFSGNDSGVYDLDNYNNFYQARYLYMVQNHYRWRYDNGGE